jgi:hypothetical protein
MFLSSATGSGVVDNGKPSDVRVRNEIPSVGSATKIARRGPAMGFVRAVRSES